MKERKPCPVNELTATEGEPDLAKVRIAIASVDTQLTIPVNAFITKSPYSLQGFRWRGVGDVRCNEWSHNPLVVHRDRDGYRQTVRPIGRAIAARLVR